MIDGVTSQPFSADTLPDPEPELISNRDKIIEFSRQTYGNKKSTLIGDHIKNKDEKDSQAKPVKASSDNNSKSKFYSKSNDTSKSHSISTKPDTLAYQKPEEDQTVSRDNAKVSLSSQPINNQSQVNEQTEEVALEPTQQLDSNSETEYSNPIMAKKLKEVFSRSNSSYGESEYLVKEKLLKDLNQSNQEENLSISSLVDELLLEVKSNLMVEKENKKNDMHKGKSINFDK
jgi:uncharacterized membrane protein